LGAFHWGKRTEMPARVSYDAIVVGSGPNGLAAAIRLAQAGRSVLVLEANQAVGGGARSAELTLPGFVHDICSAVHPLALASPFFRHLGLEKLGLRWVEPEFPLAHPLEDGAAVVLRRSVIETAGELGRDGRAYRKLFSPFVESWDALAAEYLKPLLRWPKHPLALGRFGIHALRSASGQARACFAEDGARVLFAGMGAHSFLDLEQPGSAAFALVLGMLGHAVGWPLPRGGSQVISDMMAAQLRRLGGEIVTGLPVTTFDQLAAARVVLMDVTPRQLLAIAGHKLPAPYCDRLKKYRYGPGVFKLDYALSSPVPWRSPLCSRAGTVHIGGTLAEIAESEHAVSQGKDPERPFVILSQPTLFDPTRAPAAQHVAWAYCHVPQGSVADMREKIDAQIERFAPGFRDCILACRATSARQMTQHNANLVGGDINGGAADLWQLIARPVLSLNPYRTPTPGLYLCSASTPPGGGVHGMCGYHAAELALKDCFR
jgi:phytoene dehydrogenase-like protein